MTAILWSIFIFLVASAATLTFIDWAKKRAMRPTCGWCHETVTTTHPCPCACGNNLCPRCIRVVNHHVRANRNRPVSEQSHNPAPPPKGPGAVR